MLAMQYSIQLPPNYDAAHIRERVNSRSKLFDAHGGLVHKSFLYNDQEKLYAPFYVWKDVMEARDFLLDDLFHGVIETFSRHRVRSWYVTNMQYGNRDVKPSFAHRETDVIAPEERLDRYLANEQEMQAELLKDPNLYMHLIALDADRWEILRFSLWKDKQSAVKPHSDTFMDYEVLHVSEPLS
jgi:hypothetical protein